MTAPVSNAANPRLARPARAGIRSPTPPATSSAPTRYRSHWPAPMSANMSTMTGSPASFEIPPPAIIAASTTCRIQTPMLLARPGVRNGFRVVLGDGAHSALLVVPGPGTGDGVGRVGRVVGVDFDQVLA